jgi:hypothetical protein
LEAERSVEQLLLSSSNGYHFFPVSLLPLNTTVPQFHSIIVAPPSAASQLTPLTAFAEIGKSSTLRSCSFPKQVSPLVWGVLQTEFAKENADLFGMFCKQSLQRYHAP